MGSLGSNALTTKRINRKARKSRAFFFWANEMIEIDLGIKHHFSQGVYAKEMHLPKAHYAVSHKHVYDHLSVLAKGRAAVDCDGVVTEYTAPTCIEIKAGVEHVILALEDVTWFCIHATDETDPEKVDEVTIQKKGD
jgi:quercetin dioxygenase-like cupin family protein